MAQPHITSYLYGSAASTSIDMPSLVRFADAFNRHSAQLAAHSRIWASAQSVIACQPLLSLSPFTSCPKYPSLVRGPFSDTFLTVPAMQPSPIGTGGATSGIPGDNTRLHTSLPLGRIIAACENNSALLAGFGQKLSSMADRVTRAYSTYSHAEETSSSIISKLTGLFTALSPTNSALGILALGAASAGVHGMTGKEGFNPIRILTDSNASHEGFMSGLASRLTGGGTVSDAASKVSSISEPVMNAIQGNKLSITAVNPESRLSKPNDIGSCLANQERLGTGGLGTDYGTIAIQRFTTKDGKHSWLVTIPGTDGHMDSPFGWAQNVDLMSSDAGQRAKADSARYVMAAMKRAGIQPSDPVALVGHSQGGIVAASIASDPQHAFNVKHVVTAGSPIANHPIRKGTWVTSTEVNDELISSLDGAPNRHDAEHLTVRGISSDADTAAGTATRVKGAPSAKELTHGMNYQRAAWQNAQELHSNDVERHNRHFAETIRGTMDKQYYFRGRLHK